MTVLTVNFEMAFITVFFFSYFYSIMRYRTHLHIGFRVQFDAEFLACVAGSWKWWAQEKTSAREGDTRGERERLHGRPPKIVSRPLSNYLAAVA